MRWIVVFCVTLHPQSRPALCLIWKGKEGRSRGEGVHYILKKCLLKQRFWNY